MTRALPAVALRFGFVMAVIIAVIIAVALADRINAAVRHPRAARTNRW
jgi:hypothetical protein